MSWTGSWNRKRTVAEKLGESVKLLEHWDIFSTPKGLVSSIQQWLLDVLTSDIRIIITAVIYRILNVCQTHLHTMCPLILPSTSSTLFYCGDAEQREVQSCDQGHTASNCRSQELNPGSLASALTPLTTMLGLWEYLLNHCLEESGSSIKRIHWIIKNKNRKILEEEIFR